jgi:pimeloyl-ACP methyl ester carboxylesterase
VIAALLAASLVAAAPQPFAVHVTGKGPDVLLVPGLACSAEVWDATAAHLAKDHRVHAFTLAGFAGQPRVAAPVMPAYREAIAEYIVKQRLTKPVIVGHSLGATLALSIAAEHPELVAGVVAVDGVPFLSALFDPAATAESSRGPAEALRAQMARSTPEQYARQSRMAVASMVKSSADAERIAAWGARSDPSAVGDAMAELLSTDLRPAMAKVTAPILELAATDFAQDDGARKELVARYESQLARAPKHRVVAAAAARHFIMYDDAQFLLAQLDAFLGEAQK